MGKSVSGTSNDRVGFPVADNKKEEEKKEEEEGEEFYTHRDLTSDYYQVMIAKGRPTICKILWGFVILGFLIFTGTMVYSLMSSYLEYNSYNSENDVWTPSVALPAIMLCNTNYLNYTKMQDTIADKEWLTYMGGFMNLLNLHNGSDRVETSIKEEFVKYLDAFNVSDKDGNPIHHVYHTYSTNLSYFLVGDGATHPFYKFASKWGSFQFIPNSPNYAYHKYGMCLRVNDDQSFVQTMAGNEGGFTIDLNVRIAEYLPYTKTKGFMIYLLNPNETLVIDKQGILVSPGTENFIELRKNEKKRQESPFGSCQNTKSSFNPDIYQSVRECEQDQYLRKEVKSCGCIPWYLWGQLMKNGNMTYLKEWAVLAGYNDTIDFVNTTCGIASLHMCDIAVIEEMRSTTTQTLSCREPCQFDDWDYNMFSVEFPPTEEYYELLMQHNIVNLVDGSEFNFTYAEANYVRIHIYYPQIKVTEVEQEKAYELSNFIAEFGGTVDLMIGFSFFTIFQVLEMVIAWCVYRTCRRRAPPSVADPRPPAPATPIPDSWTIPVFSKSD